MMNRNVSEEKFDIIIQGGQSNAEGCGLGPVAVEYTPTDRVFSLTSEKQTWYCEGRLEIEYADKPFLIEPASERGGEGGPFGDFSLTFAKKYVESGLLEKGRKLLIIRAAIGGTSFQLKHWGVGNILYNKMLEKTDYALALNGENRVVAFLWHQGESDGIDGNTPERFYGQLTQMLRSVRARYGEGVPFVAGDFVYEWKRKNAGIALPIIDRIRRVVGENALAAFVETDGLLSNNETIQNGDDIHFCRQSLHELGERYFRAYAMLKQ